MSERSKSASDANRHSLLDGVTIAACALGVYLSTASPGMYAADGQGFVYWLSRGEFTHPKHFLYMPIVGAFHTVVSPLGLDEFESLRVASACFTSLGLVVLRRALAVFGRSRTEANLTTLLCATSPAIVFFASVVEIHGVFFAFAALAWLALAATVRTRSPTAALALGVSTALSASVHATGHLMLAIMLPLLWAACGTTGGKGMARWPWLAAVTVAAHAVGSWSVGRTLGAGSGLGNQAEFFWELALAFDVRACAATLWNEWVYAFLPISVTWLFAFRARSCLRHGLASLLGLLAYLGATTLMLGAVNEHGAYLIPMVVPAATLTAARLPKVVVYLCIAIGLAVSWQHLHEPGNRITRLDPSIVELADYAREHECFVICHDQVESPSLARFAPTTDASGVADLIAPAFRANLTYEQFCAYFDALVHHYDATKGPVMITAAALQQLRASDFALARRFARQHLPSRYDQEEVAFDQRTAIVFELR